MDNSNYSPVASDEFGMNEQDIKNYKLKTLWKNIKYFFSRIEPSIIRVFQTILYWTIKITKSVVTTAFKMVLGKEV